MQTRSDKSDLKQHSFLTAHFTAFFGYINEVAYLVDSGKWVVDSFARETLNEQRATPPTNPLFLNYLLHQISIFVAIVHKIGAGLKLGSRYRKLIMQYTLVH